MRKAIEAAKRKFRAFTGMEPKHKQIGALSFSIADEIVFVPGHVVSIIYDTVRDGKRERYIHDFQSRPVLAISSDGKSTYILAGEYKFTERGFVDQSPRNRSRRKK